MAECNEVENRDIEQGVREVTERNRRKSCILEQILRGEEMSGWLSWIEEVCWTDSHHAGDWSEARKNARVVVEVSDSRKMWRYRWETSRVVTVVK